MSSTRTFVDSLREVMQDLLVPELKSVKTSIDALRSEIVLRDEKLEQAMRLGFENNAAAIQRLSEKLDFAIDIRERLASLEARMPRQ